jgi:NADH:ubiquinone oxidoreductase subunit D
VPDVGFLRGHRRPRNKTYMKVIPLTDRMDYLAPMSNNPSTYWPRN